MNGRDIQQQVRDELSPARYAHTAGVVKTATALASQYGVDVQKAEVAAWLHDFAREWPNEQLQRLAEGMEIPSGFGWMPALLHGPIAAAVLKERFSIADEEIANAIRYHTTGRVGMSALEKLICLADAIEPGRDYDGVETLRQLSRDSLDKALAASFDVTIRYLLDCHQPIFPLTVMARNDLWQRVSA